MISGNVLSVGSPQDTVQFNVSPLDDLVAFSSQPTRLAILRQVVE